MKNGHALSLICVDLFCNATYGLAVTDLKNMLAKLNSKSLTTYVCLTIMMLSRLLASPLA